MYTPPKIIFFGTPGFAAGCLEKMIAENLNIVAVITAPDRPKGRGQQLSESEVKACAMKHALPVLQPSNLKDPNFLDELKNFQPDLGVVVAFRMMPEVVWNMPQLGTINLHASLLPDYRGAAPINWAIINGEEKTGVTTFFLKHEIDTGDLIAQEEVGISENMNAGELHDELMRKGASLLVKSIKQITDKSVETISQNELISDHCALHKAPKIHKNDCRIDWNKSDREIHNFVRGLSPYPGAWSVFKDDNNKDIHFKIFETQLSGMSDAVHSKKIVSDGRSNLYIGANNTLIEITSIQVEGKKRMDIPTFLRGFNINDVQIK